MKRAVVLLVLLALGACHRKWNQQPDAAPEFVPKDEELHRRTPGQVKQEVDKQVDIHQKRLDEATEKELK